MHPICRSKSKTKVSVQAKNLFLDYEWVEEIPEEQEEMEAVGKQEIYYVFLGFEIFGSGIFLGRKMWQVFFWMA